MRACMLQPRGGSDARADFAEQVAVWISDCPLVVGGIAPGPSAGRRPARVRFRAAKRRVRFCGYCTLGHKQFMCFVALKLDSIGWCLIGNSVYICIYPDKIAPGPDWFIKVPTQRAQILSFGFDVYDFFAFLQNRDSSLAAPIHTLNSAHTKHKLVNPRYQ